jgi:hypothetical protein
MVTLPLPLRQRLLAEPVEVVAVVDVVLHPQLRPTAL